MEGRALRRTAMLGLDGLSLDFVDAPFVAEQMPALRQLIAENRSGVLRSTIPPYTGPAWTTITTGVDPGRHGIFGFTDKEGKPVLSSSVPAPRVWDYVGAAGGRSIVVNVPLTHPPRPIEGILVSGMPAPSSGSYTYPTEIVTRLDKATDGAYVIDESIVGTPRVGTTLQRLKKMTDARRLAIADLMREPWDLFAAVYVLPDRLGHPWWKYLVPGHPIYDSPEGEQFRRSAVPALRALDQAIEGFVADLPAGTGLLVCSDHGFGHLRADIFLDIAFERAGLIESPRTSGLLRTAARIARGPVGKVLPRSLIERGKRSLGNEGGMRRAWSTPKFEWGVRLADPEDAALRSRVTRILMELRSPEGETFVTSVKGRNEVYRGSFTDAAPDLIPFMSSEEIEIHEGLHASDVWVDRTNIAWGTHASDGAIVLTDGNSGSMSATAPDVTATLLALLGLRAPDLDGRSVAGQRPTTEVVVEQKASAASGYDPAEEEAIMEHLRGLGYVE